MLGRVRNPPKLSYCECLVIISKVLTWFEDFSYFVKNFLRNYFTFTEKEYFFLYFQKRKTIKIIYYKLN